MTALCQTLPRCLAFWGGNKSEIIRERKISLKLMLSDKNQLAELNPLGLSSFALALYVLLYVLLPWQEAHCQLAACIIIEIPADAEAPIGDARDKVKSLHPTAEYDAFGAQRSRR